MRPEARRESAFILALHGGGSYGNWQRHYFPLLDYKDKYRLVIATPNSPTRVWTEADDQYLQNIVEFVVGQLGRQNVKAFWLVGHSQGGLTSNRIIRTDFFKSKVDGWLSLSSGRLGGNPGRSATFAPAPPAGSAAPPLNTSSFAAVAALLRELPTVDFSFIYETGQREVDEKGVPDTSDWAKKVQLRCARRRRSSTASGLCLRQQPPQPAASGLGIVAGAGRKDAEGVRLKPDPQGRCRRSQAKA